MKLQPAQIEEMVVSGEIGALALDTNIFGDPEHTTLEHGLIKHLYQFKNSQIKFVLSEIVVNEILSHMTSAASAAHSALSSSLKEMGNSWNISRSDREKTLNSITSGLSSKEQADKRFDTFKDATGCVIVSADGRVPVEELVSRYFQKEPPFGSNIDKKYEFPDAIALISLEHWAIENGESILIVSNDSDWHDFCKSSSNLHAMHQLSDVLSLFNMDAANACQAILRQIDSNRLQLLTAKIGKALELFFDQSPYNIQADSRFFLEWDILGTTIQEVRVELDGAQKPKFKPIEYSDHKLFVEINIEVDIEVESEFSLSIHDSIDDDYFPMGSAIRSTSTTVDLTALMTITIEPEQIIEFDDIEVLEDYIEVNFGEIEPDWSDDGGD